MSLLVGVPTLAAAGNETAGRGRCWSSRSSRGWPNVARWPLVPKRRPSHP